MTHEKHPKLTLGLRINMQLIPYEQGHTQNTCTHYILNHIKMILRYLVIQIIDFTVRCHDLCTTRIKTKKTDSLRHGNCADCDVVQWYYLCKTKHMPTLCLWHCHFRRIGKHVSRKGFKQNIHCTHFSLYPRRSPSTWEWKRNVQINTSQKSKLLISIILWMNLKSTQSERNLLNGTHMAWFCLCELLG